MYSRVNSQCDHKSLNPVDDACVLPRRAIGLTWAGKVASREGSLAQRVLP